MSDPLKDWEEMQSEWQSYQPDVQKIKKTINWVTWRMGAILAFDVIAILLYIPFLIFFVSVDENSLVENSWHYLLGLLLIYGVYLDFKIRLPIFRAQGESTKDVLELYLKRTQAGVTIGRIGKNFSWVLLVAFVLWYLANLLLPSGNPKIADWEFGLFGVVWIAVFVVLCRWYENKKQKEFEKLNKLWQDYIE